MAIDGIFFIGHVSVDVVQNVNGSNVQPGGAALYAAVAAKTLFEDVYLVSAIGNDYPFLDILNFFQRRFLKVSTAPSTRFTIRYNALWEAKYLEANYGAGLMISPSLVPVKNIEPGSIVHISPLPPPKVKRIVHALREKAPKTLISVNAWMGYIKGGNRSVLREVASEVDFFMLNDSEAKALTEARSLSTALKILKSKMLVVTLGELGAIISKEDGEIHMIPALRFPIERLVDTTGAGDAWCGSFLAAYKQTGDLMKSVTAASVISSIKCSGWGFSKLLNLKFKRVDDIIEYVIGLKEGGMQKKIPDYLNS